MSTVPAEAVPFPVDVGAFVGTTTSARVLDELSLRRRARKLAGFLAAPPLDSVRLTPHPWNENPALYYFITTLNNADGHGGYSRLNYFDENGIPFKILGERRQYHPLVVAGYAMKMLAISATRCDAEAGARARRMIPPLIASARKTGAWGGGNSPDSMTSDRAHSNVQGAVISALLRLCGGCPSGEMADVIDRAAGRLLSPVEQDGSVARMEGGIFLQEAPWTPFRHILNGCITGLFGLYDLADSTGHEKARRTAADIDQTLLQSIHRFHALRDWSLYALDAYGSPYLASMYYHWLAIVQVRVVAMRTGEKSLLEAVGMWEAGIQSARKRFYAGFAKMAQVIWMRDVRRLRLDVCP